MKSVKYNVKKEGWKNGRKGARKKGREGGRKEGITRREGRRREGGRKETSQIGQRCVLAVP